MTGFGIEIRFLSRSYAATSHHDWRAKEWPPHPARLFSAMVSEWAFDGESAEERRALEWLESQDPPDVFDPGDAERATVVSFVPKHDKDVVDEWGATPKGKKWNDLLTNIEKFAARGVSEARGKAPKTVPSTAPLGETVAFIWRGAAADGETLRRLDGVLERVVRLGHSSSFVSCKTILPDACEPNLFWDDDALGGPVLRWVGAGQLAELESIHAAHGESDRARLLPYRSARYRRAGDTVSQDRSDMPAAAEWLKFEFDAESRRFPDKRAVEVARAMRRCIMSWADNPIPPEISGHAPGGGALKSDHIGFHPLPYAGGEYADGRIMGIAVSTPPALSREVRRALYRAVGKWMRKDSALTLRLDGGSLIRMAHVEGESGLATLSDNAWMSPSKTWTSATPIALNGNFFKENRNGKNRVRKPNGRIKEEKAARSLESACAMSGFPLPESVEFGFAPYLNGAAHTSAYPAFRQGGRRRMILHATIRFPEPVAGPMAIGAGRHLGLGLMKPAGGRQNA